MTAIVTALAVTSVLCGIAFVVLPETRFAGLAGSAFALFFAFGIAVAVLARKLEPKSETVPTEHPARSAQTHLETRRTETMGFLFAWLSAFANVATGVIIVLMFFFGWTSLPLPAFDVPLMTNSVIGLGAYMGLNTLSGKLRPHGFFFRWILDFGTSLFAAAMIWGTFASVHLGLAKSLNFATTPGAYQLLIVLSGAALLDLVFNQVENAKEAIASITGRDYVAPVEAASAGTVVRRAAPGGGTFSGATIHQLNDIDCGGKDVIIHPARDGETARIEIVEPDTAAKIVAAAPAAPAPSAAAPAPASA